MIRSRRKSGFTLIELMVAMALLAVIIGAAMGAFMSTNLAANQAYVSANLQENTRLALDALASDLRVAGLGASDGTVGIAPGGAWSMRVPTIYPMNQTMTDTNGVTTYTVTSIFILGAEPATMGFGATSDGIEGVVTDPTQVKVLCYTSPQAVAPATANAQVDCTASAIGTDGVEHGLIRNLGGNTFSPILVHDHQRAAVLLPTSVSGFSGGVVPPTPQIIDFSGSSGAVKPSPNPTAPFGFAQGFQVARLRAVHWYLKQTAGQPPRLYRSRPTLTTAADFTTGCANPFVDETNLTGGVQGVEIGTGPVASLQARFIFDFALANDPTQFTMSTSTPAIDPCSGTILDTMRQLREVRLQMVAISATQLKDSNNKPINRFTTPAFEGTGGSTTLDAFPRRAYVTRVAPRNFVPYH